MNKAQVNKFLNMIFHKLNWFRQICSIRFATCQILFSQIELKFIGNHSAGSEKVDTYNLYF